MFKIDVKDGTETWTIYKRYSDFVNLHNQVKYYSERNKCSKLKERFQEKSLPSLPPKRSIFDLGVLLLRDDKFMEQRRVLLEHYLKTLLLEAHVFQTSEGTIHTASISQY